MLTDEQKVKQVCITLDGEGCPHCNNRTQIITNGMSPTTYLIATGIFSHVMGIREVRSQLY